MTDDCSACNDQELLINASCHEKDFRWNVIKTLCWISEYLAAQSSGECGCVEQGEAYSAAIKGTLLAGSDGTNYQLVSTDSEGRVNVNATVTPVKASSSDQTVASVNGTVSTVLAANSDRIGGWVRNIGSNAIFVRFGGGATVLLPTKLEPGDVLLFGAGGAVYTGIVTAITAGTTESLEVTEELP